MIKKLIELGFVDDQESGLKLIKHYIDIETHMNFDQFQIIFAKSMLKGSFMNLSKRIFTRKFSSEQEMDSPSLTNYKRSLMMSGIQCPNSEISVEEGMQALEALEKYQNNSLEKSKLSPEEIHEKLFKLIRIYYQMTQENYKDSQKFLQTAQQEEMNNPLVICSIESKETRNSLNNMDLKAEKKRLVLSPETQKSKLFDKRFVKQKLNVISGNLDSRSQTPTIKSRKIVIDLPRNNIELDDNETKDIQKAEHIIPKVLSSNFTVNKYILNGFRTVSAPKRFSIKKKPKSQKSRLEEFREKNKHFALSSELLTTYKYLMTTSPNFAINVPTQ